MTAAHPALIAARGVVRHFGDEPAIDGVDLTVAAGEIHAIVGLNGAGKTTLMRLLLGMLHLDDGSASVLGVESATAPAPTWRAVGHLIETPFAYSELTVRENLEAAAALHGMNDATPAVATTVNDFGLERWADRRARVLSLGNRQRLGLASALIHEPTVLVLDEPSNALDPAGVVFIRDLLRKRAADGAAILVSSHHLDELARIADTITVMHRGRIVGTLEPDGVDLERRFFEIVHEADARMRGEAG